MRAVGHVKWIGKELYELYEIRNGQDLKYFETRIDFIDYPGKITPNEGDHFLSWYWIPLRMVHYV